MAIDRSRADCPDCGAPMPARSICLLCGARAGDAPQAPGSPDALRGRAALLARADLARQRFKARNARLQRLAEERRQCEQVLTESATTVDAVAAALARAKARRA